MARDEGARDGRAGDGLGGDPVAAEAQTNGGPVQAAAKRSVGEPEPSGWLPYPHPDPGAAQPSPPPGWTSHPGPPYTGERPPDQILPRPQYPSPQYPHPGGQYVGPPYPYPGPPYPGQQPYPGPPRPYPGHPGQPYPGPASPQGWPAPYLPAGGSPYPPPWHGDAPPRRTHRWGLGAYVIAEIVFLAASLLLGVAFFDPADPSAVALVLALLVPTVLAATTAILITVLRGNGPKLDLGLRWSWNDVGLGLAFGFGGLLLTIPASLIYASVVGPEEATSAVGDFFAGIQAGPVVAVSAFLIVVFVAPLCEEILYRGLLWGGLERVGANRWWAFALTTLLFALAHFELTRTPLLLVVSIPIGLARLYTGRLLASIVAHQVNNLLPGVVLMLALLGAVPLT